MAEAPVADDVVRLLRDRIESFEQLEILLLLVQEREHSWTPEAVGKRLHVSSVTAAEALDHLCRGNLLDVRVGREALVFRYNPGTPELDGSVKNLVSAYSEKRIVVMRQVSANAVARVRNMAIRMFADAFVIARNKKDG